MVNLLEKLAKKLSPSKRRIEDLEEQLKTEQTSKTNLDNLYQQSEEKRGILTGRIETLTGQIKELEKRLIGLSTAYIYYNPGQGVLVVNEDGVIIDASPSIDKVTGHFKKDLVGINYSAVVPDSIPLASREKYELPFRKRNGPTILAEIKISGEGDGRYGIRIRDLSGITMQVYDGKTEEFRKIRATKVDLTEMMSTDSEIEAMKTRPSLFERVAGAYREFFGSTPLLLVCKN